MRKAFSVWFLLIIMVYPAFAANWLQIDEKLFIDTSSLSSYDYKLNFDNNEIYSIWEKALNDGTEYWKKIENIYGKKIWYNKSLYVVNCTKKEIVIKSTVSYDLNNNVIDSHDSDYLEWQSIVPETLGEYMYSLVCTPASYAQPPFVQDTKRNKVIYTSSGSKIRVKSRR